MAIGEHTTFDDPVDTETLNQVKLEVNPIGTGLYPDRLTLTSAYDMRIIDVEITGRKLGHNYTLTFDTQALQTVQQSIPLINTADSAMTVNATVWTSLDDLIDRTCSLASFTAACCLHLLL